MRDEAGSLAAFVAVLATGLLVLVGLVVDGGRALATRHAAMDVAEQAARVGADQLSVDSLRSGAFQIDPGAAADAVDRYLAATGMTGTVDVTDGAVIVHVTSDSPTTILRMIGIEGIAMSATASATDLHGVTTGSGGTR
jgi:Flp pilus assembly protein TadG